MVSMNKIKGVSIPIYQSKGLVKNLIIWYQYWPIFVYLLSLGLKPICCPMGKLFSYLRGHYRVFDNFNINLLMLLDGLTGG